MSDVNAVGLTRQEIANLITPTARYKRQAWIAMAGLLGFIAMYFSLATWFLYSGVSFLFRAYPQGLAALVLWLVGFSAAFLGLFMFKALFFVKKGGTPDYLEIEPADEPQLFETCL